VLKKHPRHLAVLDLAVERANENNKTISANTDSALGVALHESFGSIVAMVVEVSVSSDKEIRVLKITAAVDCGFCVNPAGVAAQVESSVAFGLSAALWGKIDLKDGKVQQSNFHDYRVLRMNEMPLVETHIVPSTESPEGMGEPALPPVAPAVANALFALTGQRLRSLPLQLA
jgi:isoquinoline 1-oxidoreductase beta subunit